ncbi:MAG: SUMF1/EgtB/PvdO family nonheme iron enzyme [Anaerolineae bacterium]
MFTPPQRTDEFDHPPSLELPIVMTPAFITPELVAQAMRDLDKPRRLAANPLSGLALVRQRHAQDPLAGSAGDAGRTLAAVLRDLVMRNLSGHRGEDVRDEPLPIDVVEESLAVDFSTGDHTRAAWSTVYHRWVCPTKLRANDIQRVGSVSKKTEQRRVSAGISLIVTRLDFHEQQALKEEAERGSPPPVIDDTSSLRRWVVENVRRDGLAAIAQLPSSDGARADAPVVDIEDYLASRVLAWADAPDSLFYRCVELTLLLDQGEEAADGRWRAEVERYPDLVKALDRTADPVLVLLGAPGSGKSTLLRRLELDLAIEGLRDGASTVTFFLPLSRYRSPSPRTPPPSPRAWLGERWAARFPALPSFDELFDAGRLVLLLDALNEMPHADMADYRERVLAWKEFLQAAVVERPGNRVIFSCRSLDYSAPLSSPTLPVPQLRIEPMSDERMARFLRLYSPAHGESIWRRLQHSPQQGLLRTPYFLSLLAQQVEAEGRLPDGHAALFTGYVRQVLRREVERGHRVFAPEHLLTARDCRRTVQRVPWRTPFELPEHGPLIPRLAELAYGMQRRATATGNEASQVRAPMEAVLALLDHPQAEDIVLAGAAMSVLDEDMAGSEVMFFHQLLQEYFAARRMAPGLDAALVQTAWRADAVAVSLPDVLASLAPSEPLPPPEPTGWEETAVLAAAMSPSPEAFVAALGDANLPLAARCAAQPEAQVGEDVRRALAWQLVRRSRDPEADLRARVAAGLALGELGDPRFERRLGPDGPYLLPPLVAIPGGVYPIGSDDGPPEEQPRHLVELAAFHIGQFPVTNAEWACFMAAGGYEDERWWDTEAARAWQSGEGTAEGLRWDYRLWRRRFRAEPGLLEERHAAGRVPEQIFRGWQARMLMTDQEFEAHLNQKWPGGPKRAPEYWQDAAFTNPAQPVVGVSWFEARAYCAWLSAQSGRPHRLPSEAEWEAAARGPAGRRHAYGDEPADGMGNTVEAHVRRPSPVGVFPDGDTPEGVADMAGNVYEWTTSLSGRVGEAPAFPYPYGKVGCDDGSAGGDVARVVRGGAWSKGYAMQHASRRLSQPPAFRGSDLSCRLRSGLPGSVASNSSPMG